MATAAAIIFMSICVAGPVGLGIYKTATDELWNL